MTSFFGQRVESSSRIYELGRVLGNGSFGVVCEARAMGDSGGGGGCQYAIKRVLQDPRYKNRELDIMKQLTHPNVVMLRDYFFTEQAGTVDAGGGGGAGRGRGAAEDAAAALGNTQRYLSIVMEFIPETVYKVLKSYTRANQSMPILMVQVYTYQMLRAMGYLHSMGICHRDIKPQNLLVDVKSHVLKICDFGSAKRLYPGEVSVSYICSRFYRAPELMLGATEYTCAIDTWSMGCVLAELLSGKPLFAGATSVDQLVKIIQVLGAPTKAEMNAMNRQYAEFDFPEFSPKEWHLVIDAPSVPSSAFSLLSQMLCYIPKERIAPYEALAHPFFDPLRKKTTVLPGDVRVPNLFDFSQHELQQMSPNLKAILVPDWYRT